jgi:formylmethanofuran dehydrogenase subunit A
MGTFDLIIRGGTIVDGKRNPRSVGDIGVKDGRVAAMGGRVGGSAKRVIDADGLIVAPGSSTCIHACGNRWTPGARSPAGTVSRRSCLTARFRLCPVRGFP